MLQQVFLDILKALQKYAIQTEDEDIPRPVFDKEKVAK